MAGFIGSGWTPSAVLSTSNSSSSLAISMYESASSQHISRSKWSHKSQTQAHRRPKIACSASKSSSAGDDEYFASSDEPTQQRGRRKLKSNIPGIPIPEGTIPEKPGNRNEEAEEQDVDPPKMYTAEELRNLAEQKWIQDPSVLKDEDIFDLSDEDLAEALRLLRSGEIGNVTEEWVVDPDAKYVPLHVHTDFSFLDGASQIPALVTKAKSMNIPAIAITDHGVMHGAIELIKECSKQGIKPIIGNEMYLINGNIAGVRDRGERRYHLVVLAKNTTGYKNLVKLTTISHLYGSYYKPRINKQLLEKYKEGLIVCSACLGSELSQTLLKIPEDRQMFLVAMDIAKWYQDVFGDDFYIELQDHGYIEDRMVNPFLVEIAQRLNIKTIATNDSHYTNSDECVPHDALICVQTGKKISDQERLRYSGTEFFKSGEEMQYLFIDHIEPSVVRQALRNTLEVAEKVEPYNILGEPRIPNFPIPDNMGEKEYLRQVAVDGLRRRLERKQRRRMMMSKSTVNGKGNGHTKGMEEDQFSVITPPEYEQRLNFELDMIVDMGFASYFLVVWDYIKFARDNDVPVGPGRGSAAGSLVAYCMEITDIDPIEHGLLFERFLNPERKSMPDIDSDFSVEGRQKVIDYVSQKYGDDHVAQIITFNRLTSRAVLKDVARVLDVPLQEADRTSKMIPVVRGKPAKLDLLISEQSPVKEFRDRYNSEDPEHAYFQNWVNMARGIEGTNKTFGVHAAGVVISAGPLDEVVPLTRGKEGEIITQYAMEDIESLGLLKMDFLGLKNLSVIESALRFIHQRYEKLGIDFELDLSTDNLKLDDARTYAFLASKQLDGIFQLDASTGMRQIVRELKPSSLDDISSILALYRPGPLDAGLIPKFINRKHGTEMIEYEFAELEPILKETYGILVYQEQIMQVARTIGGYSLGQADILRRAMGKKKADVMEKEKDRFVQGAESRGFDKLKAAQYFDIMQNFAEYCFNMSHSKAYALVTFQTAFLKANYPVEFSAALLEANATVFDKLPRYLNDASLLGVQVLPPLINQSGLGFKPVIKEADYDRVSGSLVGDGKISFGLDTIKGVGSAAKAIVDERERNGPFKSFTDMCFRVDDRLLTKRALDPMIRCGVFDELTPVPTRYHNRKILTDKLDDILTTVRKFKRRSPPKPKKPRAIKKGGKKGRETDSEEPAISAEEQYTREVAEWEEESERKFRQAMDEFELELATSRDDFSVAERFKMEKELLGFRVSGNPLWHDRIFSLALALRVDPYEAISGVSKTVDLDDGAEDGDDSQLRKLPTRLIASGSEVVSLGVISTIKELTTQKGGKMAKVTFEDQSGQKCETVMFPQVYESRKERIEEGLAAVFWGKMDRSKYTQVIIDDFMPAMEFKFLRVTTSSRSLKKAYALLDAIISEWKATRKSRQVTRVPVLLEVVAAEPDGSVPRPLPGIVDVRMSPAEFERMPHERKALESLIAEYLGTVGMRKTLVDVKTHRTGFERRLPITLLETAAEKFANAGFLAEVLPVEPEERHLGEEQRQISEMAAIRN